MTNILYYNWKYFIRKCFKGRVTFRALFPNSETYIAFINDSCAKILSTRILLHLLVDIFKHNNLIHPKLYCILIENVFVKITKHVRLHLISNIYRKQYIYL